MSVDLRISGGLVADQDHPDGRRTDVFISSGRIVAVGDHPGIEADVVLDAADDVILPGFIDAHVHLDAALLDLGVHEPTLRQGVTTVIVGQDGTSHFPGTAETSSALGDYFASINGIVPERGGWTIGSYLDSVDGRSTLNVAALVPQGNARFEIMGRTPGAADRAQRLRISALVREGLNEGAVGFSTGLHYVPSRFADQAELEALCLEAARAGAPHVTHMRGYGDGASPALAEVGSAARNTESALHVSHLLAPPAILDEVDDLRRDSVAVSFDSYPYDAGFSLLVMLGLPDWAQVGSVAQVLERVSSPSSRRLINEWAEENSRRLARLRLAHVPASDLAQLAGLELEEVAQISGTALGSTVCDLLAATDLGVTAVTPNGLTQRDLIDLCSHGAHMGGSDGIYVGSHPHPRGWGAFVRMLRWMVVETGRWTWLDAGDHLAGNAARTFGLRDRGQIRPGYFADLLVLSPGSLAAPATYEDPKQAARGIRHVLINGELALLDGEVTGSLPGRALRRGR